MTIMWFKNVTDYNIIAGFPKEATISSAVYNVSNNLVWKGVNF